MLKTCFVFALLITEAFCHDRQFSPISNVKNEMICDADRWQVVKNETGFDHNRRFVLENVIDEETCRILVELNQHMGIAGDGYAKRTRKKRGSPYTNFESYIGLTPERVFEAYQNGTVGQKQIVKLMNSINKVRTLSEQLHRTDSQLYNYFVHLVCREGFEDDETNRDLKVDLSHPIHADSCSIQRPDGSCNEFQDYMPRNVSALLYLSNDYEGGEFFFTNRPNYNVTEMVVKGKCGTMVSFNSGEFHGVRALKKVRNPFDKLLCRNEIDFSHFIFLVQGRRCALALWMTLNESFADKFYSRQFLSL